MMKHYITTVLIFAAWLAVVPSNLSAQAVRQGFTTTGSQVRDDDTYSGPLSIGFSINFFGTTYSSLYVGTNGYVTFDQGQTGYDPENLVNYPQKIIAAFYGDVDTRNTASGLITWGQGTVNGRQAFAVTWNNVGYYYQNATKTNTFQIVLINRSDRATGDFDLELNYDQIQWEAGDYSGGSNGLCSTGCLAPTVGYSNGLSGSANRSYEFPNSHIPGAFLDGNTRTGLRYQQLGGSGVNGRLLIVVSNGTPVTIATLTPNSATAGAAATNLTVSGTGFATGAAVRWTFGSTTTNLSNVNVVSSTQITAQIPASLLTTAGTAQVVVANPTGSPSGPATFTINPSTGTPCTITAGVSGNPINVLPSGGSGIISIAAATGCSWNVSSDQTWLTIASGGSGTGNGTVQWRALNNASTSRRSATLSIRSTNTLTQSFVQTGTAAVSLRLAQTLFITPPTSPLRAPVEYKGVPVTPMPVPRAPGDPQSQPIAAGSVLRFSETATNRGSANSTSTATCTLDSAITPQGCSVSTGGGCSINGSTATASLGTLGSGQSATVSVNGVVQVSLPNGRTLSTTCNVNSAENNNTPDDSVISTPLFVVDPGTPMYTLALDLAPIGGGSISTNPVSTTAQFLSGSTVEVTALPAPGYQFTGWSGDLTGTTNPQTISMTAARSVKANFAPLPNGSMYFVPLAPCRVLDTRNAAGPFGGPGLTGGGVRDFPVSASNCGVPGTALAYSLNVTVVPSGNLGYLTVWPSGQPQPVVSTLNSDGRFKANAAILPAGTNGSIRAFATDNTHLVVDINGYFVPLSANDPNGLQFYSLTPCRIADTRDTNGTYGGPVMSAGSTRTIPIAGKCGVPTSAQAFSLNMTAVPTGPLAYLTVWPTGQSQPFVSTLNSPRGVNLANAAIVPAGTNGSINLYVTDTAHMVVDVNGYFGAPGGSGALSFYSLSPCRIADTRNTPNGTFAGPMLNSGEIRTYPVPTSTCGVPASAKAYVFNATVVPSGSLGYLTMYPTGVGVPGSSTLNAPDGTITSNAVLVPAGTSGGVNVFTLNATHFLFDISGYFAP